MWQAANADPMEERPQLRKGEGGGKKDKEELASGGCVCVCVLQTAPVHLAGCGTRIAQHHSCFGQSN